MSDPLFPPHVQLATRRTVCWTGTIFRSLWRNHIDIGVSLCGTRLSGTVRNWVEDQARVEEAIMQIVSTVKIVTHGYVGMTGMAVNMVISHFLKCGIQPKAKVDESLEMNTYICPVHLWESSKWNCPMRTMTLL